MQTSKAIFMLRAAERAARRAARTLERRGDYAGARRAARRAVPMAEAMIRSATRPGARGTVAAELVAQGGIPRGGIYAAGRQASAWGRLASRGAYRVAR